MDEQEKRISGLEKRVAALEEQAQERQINSIDVDPMVSEIIVLCHYLQAEATDCFEIKTKIGLSGLFHIRAQLRAA